MQIVRLLFKMSISIERGSKLETLKEITTDMTNRMSSLESRYARIDVLFSALGSRDHFFEIALIYGLGSYGRLT